MSFILDYHKFLSNMPSGESGLLPPGELLEILGKAKEAKDVNMILVPGIGWAFCSGVDIKERFLPLIKKRRIMGGERSGILFYLPGR